MFTPTHCCGYPFNDFDRLKQHIRKDYYHINARDQICPMCDDQRNYTAQCQLIEHLESAKHAPQSYLCPYPDDVVFKTVSLSAVILHLEEGTCISGMNHKKLNAWLCNRDIGCRMYTTPDSYGLVTEDAHAEEDKKTRYTEDIRGLFTCDSCNTSQRFKTIHAVQQHLLSAKHRPNVFICQTKRALDQGEEGCGKSFGALSSLVKHVESCEEGHCERERVLRVVFYAIWAMPSKRQSD